MRILRLVGVAFLALALAGALGSGAGANARHVAQVDLSTKQGVHAYLRSLGLNPARFVIQRGAFNYSGANCPGKKWTCTKATRVVQISTGAPGGNVATCTDADCGTVVQSATSGGNTYTCNQTTTTAAGLQRCDVIQKVATSSKSVNKNTVNITQVITQSGVNTTQAGQQEVKITQNNDAGPSQATVWQENDQSQDAGSLTTGLAQSQTATQTLYIAQCSPSQTGTDTNAPSCVTDLGPPTMSGSVSATVTQKVKQNEVANSATSGSQYQSSTMTGHVNQWSTSSASTSVEQDESQNVTAPSAILQTQIGPMSVTPTKRAMRGGATKGGQFCCTLQGTNPSDTFTVTQNSSQTQTPPATLFRGLQLATATNNANYHGEENQAASCGTYGTCTRSQNGHSQTDNGNNPLNNFCSNGVCAAGQILTTSLTYSGATDAVTGSNTTMAGTLSGPDQNGNIIGLGGQDVTFTVNGVSCTDRTDSSGFATCTIVAPTTPDSYPITVSFGGAGPYLPSSVDPKPTLNVHLPDYDFLGFTSPLPNSQWNAGRTIPVKFSIGYAGTGTALPDADAQSLATACSVTVTLDTDSSGTPTGTHKVGPLCAGYDSTAHQFQANLNTSSSLSAGTYDVVVALYGSYTTFKSTGSTPYEPIMVTSKK
jgi:hypothetical protein